MTKIYKGLEGLLEGGIISRQTFDNLKGLSVAPPYAAQIEILQRKRLLDPVKGPEGRGLIRDAHAITDAIKKANSVGYHELDKAWEALDRVMTSFDNSTPNPNAVYVVGTAYNALLYAEKYHISPDDMRSFKVLNRGHVMRPPRRVRLLVLDSFDDVDTGILRTLLNTSTIVSLCMCIRHRRININVGEDGELDMKEDMIEEIR